MILEKYTSEDWGHVSSDAKDLIDKCLKVSPDQRITCQGMLSHPWMIKECNDQHNPHAKDKLKKYLARRRLKMAQTVVYFSKIMESKMKL